MKHILLRVIVLVFVVSAMLTSCSSGLSESKARDVIYQDRQAWANGLMGSPTVSINVFYMGECELERNEKAMTGAEARWFVRYDIQVPRYPGFSGERTMVIDRVGGQWVPSNSRSCN